MGVEVIERLRDLHRIHHHVRVLLGSQGSVGFGNAESACGRDLNPSKDYSLSVSGSRVSLLAPNGSKLRASSLATPISIIRSYSAKSSL